MIHASLAICEKEIRSTLHNPQEIAVRLVRPIIWLVIFGNALKFTLRDLPVDYPQYILPGILVHASLLVALGSGITVKWESDIGILDRILSTPIPRLSIVFGKSLAAIFKSILHVLILLFASVMLGIKFSYNPLHIAFSTLAISMFVVGFTAIGIMLALSLGSREAYTGFIGVFAMPSLFASNSLYPIESMPVWLRIVSEINPVTYAVNLVRSLIVYESLILPLLIKELTNLFLFAMLTLLMALMFFKFKRA